jgi:hypothetical protein
MVERERELEWYRRNVEHYLGGWVTARHDGELAKFSEHIERCFDWGISAPACGRTWIAKVEARAPHA